MAFNQCTFLAAGDTLIALVDTSASEIIAKVIADELLDVPDAPAHSAVRISEIIDMRLSISFWRLTGVDFASVVPAGSIEIKQISIRSSFTFASPGIWSLQYRVTHNVGFLTFYL